MRGLRYDLKGFGRHCRRISLGHLFDDSRDAQAYVPAPTFDYSAVPNSGHRHRHGHARKDINGDTSAELPIGVTILGGKIGSMKTGATEIGKHGANYRTGESVRTSQIEEHQTTRLSGAMWNAAGRSRIIGTLLATIHELRKKIRDH